MLKKVDTKSLWEIILIQVKHLDAYTNSVPEGMGFLPNMVGMIGEISTEDANDRRSAIATIKESHRFVETEDRVLISVRAEVKEKLGLDYASLFLSEAKMVKLVLEQGNILDRSTYDVIQDIITDIASKYDADTLAKLEVISAEFEKNHAE